MKKLKYALFAALVSSVLLLAGCGKTPASHGPETTATPAPTAVPTPTPTPIPTPVPYSIIPAFSSPEYSFASDYEQVSAALSGLAQPAADPWMERFSAAGATAPAAPEVFSLEYAGESGDLIAAGESFVCVLSGKDLVILASDGRENAILSRTTVGIPWTGGEGDDGTNVSGYEKTPLAVFAANGAVAVVSDWYAYHGSAEALRYAEYTTVDLFRVSDPAAPVFLSSYGQDGIYKGSRSTNDGKLILVTEFTPTHGDPARPEGLVPAVYSGGTGIPLEADRVLLTRDVIERSPNCAVLGQYSLAAPEQPDVIALPGLRFEDVCLWEDRPGFLCRRWAEGPSRVFTQDETEIHEYAAVACTDIFSLSAADGALSVDDVTSVSGFLPDASALERENGGLWYAGSLCQGLYTQDGQGGVLWRETMTGTRIACLDPLTGEGQGLDLPENETAVTWVGLLRDRAAFSTADDNSFLYLSGEGSAEPLTEPINSAVILPWGENGYMAFCRQGDEVVLSVRDAQLRELASRRFGSDHSNTLECRQSYYADAAADILGFAADDSYCLYGYSETDGIYFRGDAYLRDWAWNARAIRVGDLLAVADTTEVFLYNVQTMELIASYEL